MPKISEKEKDLRKEKIIQHAFDLFAEKGYTETTMDDIVQSLGMSKGGIYNYFKSKEEMFLAIAESRFNKRHKVVSEFNGELSNKEKIIKYITWTLTGLFDDKTSKGARFTFEFWSVLSRNPEMREKSLNRYKLFYKDLSLIIKMGIDEGEFYEDTDIESICYIILATMDGIGFVSSVMSVGITEKVIENYLDMVLRKLVKGYKNDTL